MKTEPPWDLYRSFGAVMTHGSLSGAARTLGQTQPTIGRHIEALETDLGLPLFTRSPQGLAPTQAALDLLPHVSQMAAAAEALIRQASGDANDDRGTIRLTASEVIGGEVLPGIIAAFAERHPRIEVELVLSNRLEDLLRREVDIAVRMVRPTQGALLARKVGEVSIGFFAHRDYLQRHGMPQTFDDLRSHRLIGYDRDPAGPEATRRLGIEYEKGLFSLRTDSDLAAFRALVAGYGIGGCEWSLAQRWPDLLPVMPETELVRFDIWIAMHEDLKSSRRMRLMFDHLVEHLGAHVEIGAKARQRYSEG